MRATEAHFHWRWSHDVLECYLIGEGDKVVPNGDGYRRSRAIGQPVEYTELPNDGGSPPATFSLSPEAAQNLMDSLWTCGLRPTEGTGSAGSLAATQQHLNDMRAIVAKQLEVNFNAVQR